jgi:hypothetical protein
MERDKILQTIRKNKAKTALLPKPFGGSSKKTGFQFNKPF